MEAALAGGDALLWGLGGHFDASGGCVAAATRALLAGHSHQHLDHPPPTKPLTPDQSATLCLSLSLAEIRRPASPYADSTSMADKYVKPKVGLEELTTSGFGGLSVLKGAIVLALELAFDGDGTNSYVDLNAVLCGNATSCDLRDAAQLLGELMVNGGSGASGHGLAVLAEAWEAVLLQIRDELSRTEEEGFTNVVAEWFLGAETAVAAASASASLRSGGSRTNLVHNALMPHQQEAGGGGDDQRQDQGDNVDEEDPGDSDIEMGNPDQPHFQPRTPRQVGEMDET